MRVSFCGHKEVDVLYFNDVHAKPKYVRNFKTAVDTFDREHKDKLTFKIAGGDINMDRSVAANVFILKLMDLIGLDASSVGNHDLEGGDVWAQVIKTAKPKFKFLSANLSYSRENEVEPLVAKSKVINRKGERVGLIGVSPLDANDVVFKGDFNDYLNVQSLDKTIQSVRKEVKKLEKKGINKIFLLAHTGKVSKEGVEYYQKLSEIGGIDIIFGGHDHKEFDLWYSSERGEPVKVVSAGQAEDKQIAGEDLDSFGILNAVFDDDGVLVPQKCKNEIYLTETFPPSKEVADLEEQYLKSNTVISRVDQDLTCPNRMTQENPLADLTADAMLWVVNKEKSSKPAEIALINAGTLRGDLQQGEITVGMIRQALPFANRLVKTELTKQQIIEALNWSAKSTTFVKIAPGIMQVGGLKYSVDENHKVKNVCLIDKNGTILERLDKQPDDKKYMVVYDEFLMSGGVGLSSLKKDATKDKVALYDYSRQEALIEYLKENFADKPVEFVKDRIKYETARYKDNCNLVPVIV